MMPDLGKYEYTVLGAYGVSLVLIVGLVVASVMAARRAARALRAAEARRENG